MVADTDYPVFPSEYHYLLVLGATATGLKMENDPTWTALEDEYREILMTMQQDLSADFVPNQFTRDGL